MSAFLFIRNLRVSYLIYILHILFLAVFSYIGCNYGDLLQGAFMCVICVIGFVRRDTMETRVASIGKLDIVTVASVAILFTICEYAVLSRSGVPLSPLDVFRTAMMVCALVLACMRKVGIWTAWLLNSVLYAIGYCIHPMEAPYLLVLYVLLSVVCAFGCMLCRRKRMLEIFYRQLDGRKDERGIVIVSSEEFQRLKELQESPLDTVKGWCQMVIVVIICCAAICAPIAAVNYGIKLYDRHEIDMVYPRKLKKLNKTIHYMDTVEIEVPRVMVHYATGGRTIMDVLVTSAMRMQAACHFFVIDTILCAGAEEVTWGSQALSDITKSALSEITGCLGRANPEKRYGCKRKLEGLDSSIGGIREASMHLRDALVSFSSGYGPVVMARLGVGAMDIPEYRLDRKSVCDTIPYGPGRWERCSKAIAGLWK